MVGIDRLLANFMAMVYRISLLLLWLTGMCCLVGCRNEPLEPADRLSANGLLAKWQRTSITINGITDMSVACCDTLHLMPDENPLDWQGLFTANGYGAPTNGQFLLDSTLAAITFFYDNKQLHYQLSLAADGLSFQYTADSLTVIEDWRRLPD